MKDTAALTGRTLNGSYISAPQKSGHIIDRPTGIRVTVTVGGIQHERTVMERRVWRNMKPSKLYAQFVTINGVNYEIELVA